MAWKIINVASSISERYTIRDVRSEKIYKDEEFQRNRDSVMRAAALTKKKIFFCAEIWKRKITRDARS